MPESAVRNYTSISDISKSAVIGCGKKYAFSIGTVLIYAGIGRLFEAFIYLNPFPSAPVSYHQIAIPGAKEKIVFAGIADKFRCH